MNTSIADLRSDFEHAWIDIRIAVQGHEDGTWERSALCGARIALRSHPDYRPELEWQRTS